MNLIGWHGPALPHCQRLSSSARRITQLGIEADAAVALAALAELEPWLAGRLAARDHLFIASQKDIQRALTFLAAHEEDTAPGR